MFLRQLFSHAMCYVKVLKDDWLYGKTVRKLEKKEKEKTYERSLKV